LGTMAAGRECFALRIWLKMVQHIIYLITLKSGDQLRLREFAN